MGSDTFHKGKYYITFKRNFEDCKKDITITIGKLFENDSLRISLSDDEDPSFLCTLNVTRSDYEDLKKQQGLLIDFDNFPGQLVRLLQQCAANNMFIILQISNASQYFFEIVEHNEFRRLVHLSLKTAPATDNDIKKHMADTINSLKKSLTSCKHSASNNEIMWKDKYVCLERKIQELTHVVSKMEEDKVRREDDYQDSLRRERDRMSQERLEWQKNNELTSKSQSAAMQEVIGRKDKQIEEYSLQCKQLHDKITMLDHQLGEKSQRLSILERELQTAHIDVATIKARNTNLERDIMDKDTVLHQLRAKCLDLEKSVKENLESSKELNTIIQILKKEKLNLEERLSLSESLANKNNEAAHTTSEQLFKANQIISKLNTDLIEMKDKLLRRTAIALEQEKVIDKNINEIEDIKTILQNKDATLTKIITELDTVKEKLENADKNLKDKEDTIKNNNLVIQWLHKKMEEGCITSNERTSYSTPHRKHTDISEHDSGDIPDFYATSGVSEIDSPISEVISKTGRTGLDPKYLQPSTSDNIRIGVSNSKKVSNVQQNKYKENANVNLPKVFYKEKKSAKSTFRTTPVSAYFP